MNCMVAHETSEPDSFTRSDSNSRWTNSVACIMSVFDIISMIFTIDSNSSERLAYKWMTCYSWSMMAQITAILLRISSDLMLGSSAFPLSSILCPCTFRFSFLQLCVSPNERIAQYFYRVDCTYCRKINRWRFLMVMVATFAKAFTSRTSRIYIALLAHSVSWLCRYVRQVSSLLASSERYNTMQIFFLC